MAERFTGLLPPVVTPMRGGEIDESSIPPFVDHMAEHLDGVVLGGSCGEGPSLSFQECCSVAEAFARASGHRLTLLLGVAGTSVSEIRQLIEFGDTLGVDGYLVPPPFYFKNTGRAVRDFYRTVAGFTSREVVIYDNPFTTSTLLSAADIAEIVRENPNVNHVKITDTALDKPSEVRALSDVTMLSGSDEVMQHQANRGCDGVVTAIPQVYPKAGRAWMDAVRRGDGKEARRLYDRMLPYVNELLAGPDQYPAVVKFALARMGVLASDEVRPPLTPLDELRRDEIGMIMDMNPIEEEV